MISPWEYIIRFGWLYFQTTVDILLHAFKSSFLSILTVLRVGQVIDSTMSHKTAVYIAMCT